MIKRIVKLGIGAERPGRIVYEAKLEAEDLEGLATQLRETWALYTAQVEESLTENSSEESDEESDEEFDEEMLLHLIVEVEETGLDDFDMEDELIELLDP